jgi:hypothetical protein
LYLGEKFAFLFFDVVLDNLAQQVQKALGKEKLQELGAKMQARFEQAKSKDYHGALNSNLKQVLAGALKPAKRSGRSATSRKSPALPSSKRRSAA